MRSSDDAFLPGRWGGSRYNPRQRKFADLMSLRAGTRLGAYEIQSPLGAGGMGEVYRAIDTNLGRPVAIKILPDLFAHDPERLARSEREAKTLASLNHTNIAQSTGWSDRLA